MKIIEPLTHSFLDYPSSEGSCISMYVIGCEHNCKDCSNPDLQDFNYDVKIQSPEQVAFLLSNEFKKTPFKQLALIGGDPLHPKNLDDTKMLLYYLNGHIDVIIYTGYDVEYCKKNNVTDFKFLKCGCYNNKLKQESEKTDDYIQFASKNQKLYGEDYNLISENGRYYFDRS